MITEEKVKSSLAEYAAKKEDYRMNKYSGLIDSVSIFDHVTNTSLGIMSVIGARLENKMVKRTDSQRNELLAHFENIRSQLEVYLFLIDRFPEFREREFERSNRCISDVSKYIERAEKKLGL